MFNFRGSFPRHAPALGLLLLLASACVDSPTMPGPERAPVVGIPAMQCNVNVPARTLTCTAPDAVHLNQAIAANRIIGGQDYYVKLTGTGASYDSGTETFSLGVTVQNLTQQALGTSDGNTVNGVRIFFSLGPTAYPSGTVTVANATGTAFFTEPDQPYFEYPQILEPYQISTALTWLFNMPAEVQGFTFTVYVSGPQPNEALPLVDRVWTGSTDAAWANPANWSTGVVPDSASAAAVPPDSLITGTFMPALSGDVQLTNLRVGGGSTLDLAGYTLTAWGNVDSPGTISGGSVRLAGATSLLRGRVPSLVVNGATRLQGSTSASGAVSVADGSLTASGTSLTISIP